MDKSLNPFFSEFDTPHATPPFDRIDSGHYEDAILRGIEIARSEVDAIAGSNEEPTFSNTIVALARAGADLDRVLNVFFPLNSALSDDRMMEIANRVIPQLSDYSTSIILNEKLWQRVKSVYDSRDSLSGLDTEDKMLLQNTYDSFALAGANLQGVDRETFRSLKSDLSSLTTLFGQNVLRELNTYEIWLTTDDLSGLPESAIEAAALAAGKKGREGEYLFTLEAPVYFEFMKYSDRRDLRERMYRLYTGRNIKGEFSNIDVMKQIAEKRRRIARLLGAGTYAEHATRKSMAENPANVMNLLLNLRDAYRPALDAEMAELTRFAAETEGKPVEIMPWDYPYYNNKLKNSKYNYDDQALRPYFKLDNVIEGVFGLATRLYGLRFRENPDIQVYHPDVKAFDVTDEDGTFIGVIYTDFFPRPTKRSGAWMTDFAPQMMDADGKDHRPIVSIVMNFTKPTADKPSLLTPGEVGTFLHEFGHALHGLLSRCKYSSLSGTNVYQDFVELPSQFNENFLTRKEFLDSFARHYITGEMIPAELVERLKAQHNHGATYACMRQLSFGLIDMKWHSYENEITDTPEEIERSATETVTVFPGVEGSMVSPQFSHIFSGGYAAGYYSYKWAEVLDADAFAAFEEHGIFDRATAMSFRHNILERGGTENPAVLYRRFRGKNPTIDALLRRDGIKA